MPDEATVEPTVTSLIDRLRGLLGGAALGGVTTAYGAPAAYTGAFHSGIDFQAAPGAEIHEPIGGTVQRVWYDASGGQQIAVQTATGFSEVYAHLAYIGVSVGDQIAPGAIVGRAGSSGFTTGPHLHYEIVRPGGEVGTQAGTVDPLLFISEFVSQPTELSKDVISGIESAAREAATKIRFSLGLYSEANAADDLRRQFPNVPAGQLSAIVSGLATRSPEQGGPSDPQAVPVLGGIAGTIARAIGFREHPSETQTHISGNPLDRIADDLDRLTRDLTASQKWAAYGLTFAAVGLIMFGLVLYVRGGPQVRMATA